MQICGGAFYTGGGVGTSEGVAVIGDNQNILGNPINGRSEPARDSGGSANICVESHTAIASRLTPTGFCVWLGISAD
ncbi:hypothetical protein PkoCFBP13504_13960 [Pseudomonas koreensis]|nr:hypothetical protein PkoCFBP13504_13960 [Pseudomonas koreensis]